MEKDTPRNTKVKLLSENSKTSFQTSIAASLGEIDKLCLGAGREIWTIAHRRFFRAPCTHTRTMEGVRLYVNVHLHSQPLKNGAKGEGTAKD